MVTVKGLGITTSSAAVGTLGKAVAQLFVLVAVIVATINFPARRLLLRRSG